VSPRRFDRRTYMIVAPGWSALAFKAAMSASSASTTIRSAFPFTLSPTVNCHDIVGLPQAKLGYERALPRIDQTLRATSVFFCALVLSCRGVLSAHTYTMLGRLQRSLYSRQRPSDIGPYLSFPKIPSGLGFAS